jgi:autotransporter passenger strand-loop-strand repeat protein
MANGVVVSSGSSYTVSSGQTDTNDVVLSGGTLVDSGTIINTTDSGAVDISSGGVANGTLVVSGGEESVAAGGQTISTTLIGTNGPAVSLEFVESGGTAIDLTIDSGGVAEVTSSGGGSSAPPSILAAGKLWKTAPRRAARRSTMAG